MADHSDELLAAVRELRDLVRLLAEPAITERDKKLRAELRHLVGRSLKKSNAVLLMDGKRKQADIQRESGINQGDLSTLVKQLRAANLITTDAKRPPELTISIPSNFFEEGAADE
jgi:DNA-binding MarR family transcriptional regulator